MILLPAHLLALLTLFIFMSPTEVSATENHYAESVAIAGISSDGLTEVSVRLARFPDKREGHIWAHLAINGQIYSVVDESVTLTNGNVTDVTANKADFVGLGDNFVQFISGNRNGAKMNASVEARTIMFATPDPQVGSGDIAIHLDLNFTGDDEGTKLNQKRWEVTGKVSGKVRLNGKSISINLPGKWHEQTGPRVQFAPPFIYFNVQNQETALLAIHYPTLGRTAGYLREKSNQLTSVKQLAISPLNAENIVRTFRLTLADDRVINGTAALTRRWSVPIEGQRRPGSTVVVNSDLGQLVGALNDWQPIQN